MNNWPQISVDMSKSPTMCFCCGRDNPIGLKLKFRKTDGTVSTEFTPHKLLQGWAGFVHGGIIACLLDEAMSYAAYLEGINCITAKMEVRLKQLVMVDEPLVITGAITRKTRKLVETRADVSLKDGTSVAESTATMFVIDKPKDQDDESKSAGK